jgi:hypothetical protein
MGILLLDLNANGSVFCFLVGLSFVVGLTCIFNIFIKMYLFLYIRFAKKNRIFLEDIGIINSKL